MRGVKLESWKSFASICAIHYFHESGASGYGHHPSPSCNSQTLFLSRAPALVVMKDLREKEHVRPSTMIGRAVWFLIGTQNAPMVESYFFLIENVMVP